MKTLTLLAAAATVGALSAGVVTTVDAYRTPAVEQVDFDTLTTPTQPAYDARLHPAGSAPVKQFTIPIEDATIEIAKGVQYHGWTFGGTVPGPVIHVTQGDRVRITVVNKSPMPHSIDLHAARIAPDVAYRMVNPGQSVSLEFTARDPGAFLVHCGTPPVLMHIMQGMYLAMIVDPRGGWGTKADKEFVLVQSEFYAKDGAAGQPDDPDYGGAQQKQATYVVFNGRAFQYKDAPLQVRVGDRVRLFVVNAGPNLPSDFHIVGGIFDRVYPDGDPDHVLTGVQTAEVPPGGGAVFETVFAPDGSGEGLYAFVTHAFADAEKGAVGLIRVGNPQVATMDH